MEDTKQHILKTAANLFLQKSFKEVTMREIVEKTGLSKGAFYHYFSSKEQVFLEVVENFVSLGEVDYSQFSHESLYDFYHQYLQRLNNIFSVIESWSGGSDFASNANFYLLLFDAIIRFPGFREETSKMHEIEHNAWKEIISIARHKGEFSSPMTDEQIAKIFTHMPDGLSLHVILDGKPERVMNEIANLFDSFYEELKS